MTARDVVAQPLPRRLFKYQPFSTRTLSNLKERTVWFSRPDRFNDPFDMALSVSLDRIADPDWARLLDHFRNNANGFDEANAVAQGFIESSGRPGPRFKELVLEVGRDVFGGSGDGHRDLGVACFSERVDETLLWAHYGDGHRGVCLEFDTADPLFRKAQKVRYEDEMPDVNVVDVMVSGRSEPWRDLVLTKSRCWSYEREWRVLSRDADKAATYDWRHLTGLYCGVSMPDLHRQIAALVLEGASTQLYHMSVKPGTFALQWEAVRYQPPDLTSSLGD